MKRVIKIVAVLFAILVLGSACSQYVCPAYSLDTEVEQASELDHS